MLLYTLPPLPGRPDRLVGHILNFYTYPEFRRQGHGAALIAHIKADAPLRGIARLFLNAAPMGERLYRRAGFVEQGEKALILTLE
jgi:ribosomal protein S18 acetylase RimI-like enzyme